MNHVGEVVVRVETKCGPLGERIFSILKDRVETRCPVRMIEGSQHPAIVLDVANDLPAEGFRIDEVGPAVRVSGGSPRGLMYGVGKFLRTCGYEGGLSLSRWRGTSSPQCDFRLGSFPTSFHNSYHMAGAHAPQELVRYVEDLALWGMNGAAGTYSFILLQSWQDPQAAPHLEITRTILKAARDLGLSPGLWFTPNQVFQDVPAGMEATPTFDPLLKRGNKGNKMCPNAPGARKIILDTWRAFFGKLADIGVDYLIAWPYDDGGCGCAKCRPWGSNGFLGLAKEIAGIAREIFPRMKMILSTWGFDSPPEGEWEGLARSLAQDGGWVDYIMADSHEEFPRYPLDVGVPGNLPLVNFPEIAMWGNWPWGAFGTSVLPKRLGRLWNGLKHVVRGGMPYSEGIYEDMNKVVEFGFYWDRERTAKESLAEYIAYEYSPAVVEEVQEILGILEDTVSNYNDVTDHIPPQKATGARRTFELAAAVERRLPDWARKSWRWEVLRLRTILDRERYACGDITTATSQAAFRRLIQIYHQEERSPGELHDSVRPPLDKSYVEEGDHFLPAGE